jgi:inner membrane transporter RhtA
MCPASTRGRGRSDLDVLPPVTASIALGPASVRTDARNGASLAIASMLCIQIGLAASVGLFDQFGAQAVAWLRLAGAGVLLLMVPIARRCWSRRQPGERARTTRAGLLTGIQLGVVTAGMIMLFTEAIARLPLGTASALEFLGPLGVAVFRGRGARVLWPLLAAAGVLLLTEPWHGAADWAGVGFALAAAVCWAAYILLTQRVGDELSGLQGLSVSMPVAALVATVVVTAGPSGLPPLSGSTLLIGFGLALVVPVIPFILELLSLRRLTTAAFGTLMSLEPAIALVIGLLWLQQVPRAWPVLGIAFVVVAGIGAERSGARTSAVDHSPEIGDQRSAPAAQ